MSEPFVAILMGSDSDLPTMQATFEVLKSFGIRYEVRIHSAHRTPEATAAGVRDAEAAGCQGFICAAGMAAHLAGVVASKTVKPVIGVPKRRLPSAPSLRPRPWPRTARTQRRAPSQASSQCLSLVVAAALSGAKYIGSAGRRQQAVRPIFGAGRT